MAPLDDTRPATRFDSFNVYKTSYKKIGEHEIGVAVLVPKDLKPGKHPVMVKFHGGGLVCLPSPIPLSHCSSANQTPPSG